MYTYISAAVRICYCFSILSIETDHPKLPSVHYYCIWYD